MDTKIVFAEISSTSGDINSDWFGLLSIEKQEKINKFKFDIDCKLSLYTELIVRYQICKELNFLNEEIVFSKNQNGKPFLLNNPEFKFNISHTRNALVVAFSDSEIGIDIESIKPIDLQIANRFFTSSEQEYINSHDNPDYAFYEVWTKKEAYIKYIGTGLSTPLNSFDVMDSKINSMLNTYTANKYVISTCCSESTIKKQILNIMTENELYMLFDKII